MTLLLLVLNFKGTMLIHYTRKYYWRFSEDFVTVLSVIFMLLLLDCRSPEALHTWARAIVDVYYKSREGTLLRQARDLMNPKIIRRVEEIVKIIKDKYL